MNNDSMNTKTKLTFLVAGWLLVTSLAADGLAQEQAGRNSTRKIRVRPSKMAARIGTAVKWETSVDDALARSKKTGKPVFWYVPTLRGSFMDRKTEIDRYMMAGPFSAPQIVSLLNDRFIPVRAMPKREQQKKYDLVPYKFVEPGFLVLNDDGKQLQRVDHLTTLHVEWFYTLIGSRFDDLPDWLESDKAPRRGALNWAWGEFRKGNWDARIPELTGDADPDAAEKLLLSGMFAFRRGDHTKARALWKMAGKMQPDHPLAWKAAAEAENFGPFVRGFEIHRQLSPAAMKAGVDSVGSAAPADTYTEQELWNRSVDFLLGMQNDQGGFVDSDYDFGGTDSLPNVYTAVTALVGMALLEAREKFEGDKQKAIDQAIRRAARYVSDPGNMNPVDRDEILWAHAYRLRFLCRAIRLDANLKDSMQTAIEDLQNIQMANGTWYHEYANAFVTATALLALHEAKQAGGKVDNDKVALGIKRLTGQRFDNGAYPYATRRGKKDSDDPSLEPASAGRMPVCELALWNNKAASDAQLQKAVRYSLKKHELLAKAYKYDNHTSTYAYGGFFFWYDMRSRTEAINSIKDPAARKDFSEKQRKLVLSLPELDGCFVDSHELGRCYGTAMALICLGRLD